MEWLQVGLWLSLFVVWASAVLVVLAIVSMARDPDEDEDEADRVEAGFRPGAARTSGRFVARLRPGAD